MDPEVAKKCIDQFPRFSESTTTILKYYYELCDTQSKTAYKDTLESYKSILNALLKELDNEDLPPETRSFVIEQTIIIGENIERADDKKAKIALALNCLAYGLTIVGLGLLSGMLGTDAKIPLPDFKSIGKKKS